MAQFPSTIRKARLWRVPPRAASSVRALLGGLALAHAALLGVLGLSALLEFNRLSQNGYANNYYSAAVKSMLSSWHNFVFVAFDRGGLETVDKPPIGLWIQTASAKVFGFAPLSLLIPEAAAAVVACAALYLVVSRRFGAWAGVASALALAIFPSFVAISRDNDPDVFLILFMILACGAALRSIETGRLRWLLGSAVLLALAFNSKTLAAYLALPGIAAAYLIWAPHRPLPRLGRLLAAGLVLTAVSVAWLAFVDLTPAHQRPFVGSSTDNSEFGLTLNYNGVGRVGGQVGGPGRIPHVSSRRAAPAAVGRARSGRRRSPVGGRTPSRNANASASPARESRVASVRPSSACKVVARRAGSSGFATSDASAFSAGARAPSPRRSSSRNSPSSRTQRATRACSPLPNASRTTALRSARSSTSCFSSFRARVAGNASSRCASGEDSGAPSRRGRSAYAGSGGLRAAK